MSYELLPDNTWRIDKDPQASLIYGIDVAGIIAPGDSLAGTPTASGAGGAGLTVGAAAFSGTVISARVSGGTAGQTGSITWTWSTANGDLDQRTVYVRVLDR